MCMYPPGPRTIGESRPAEPIVLFCTAFSSVSFYHDRTCLCASNGQVVTPNANFNRIAHRCAFDQFDGCTRKQPQFHQVHLFARRALDLSNRSLLAWFQLIQANRLRLCAGKEFGIHGLSRVRRSDAGTCYGIERCFSDSRYPLSSESICNYVDPFEVTSYIKE